MAFVYRCSRSIQDKTDHLLGPCYYVIKDEQKIYNNEYPSSSFMSKAERIVQIADQSKITNQLGPGSYNINIDVRSASGCMTTFLSKVPRFEKQYSPNLKNQTENMMNISYDIKQKGRIYGMKERWQANHKQNKNIFPSIPGCQQSYGYREDPINSKFVENLNPNVVIASSNQRQSSKEVLKNGGPSYYFIKKQKKQCRKLFTSTLPLEVKQFVTENKSLFQDSRCLAKKNNGNLLVSKEERFKKPSNLKNNLLNNRLKIKFRKFIDTEKQNIIEYLQDIKKQQNNLIENIYQQKSLKNNNKKYFMNKSNRFSINNNIITKDTNNKNQSNQNEVIIQHKKNNFGYNSKRFKQNKKQKIGPGYYEQKQNQKNKTIIINSNQKRFNNIQEKLQTPGPGFYYHNDEYNNNNKKKRIINQNRKIIQKIKINSQLQSMNLKIFYGDRENKIRKDTILNKKIICTNKQIKKQNNKNMNIKQIKNIFLKQFNYNSNQQIKIQNVMKKKKNSKIHNKHLFTYNAIQKEDVIACTGHYQITGDLETKTHNITFK